MFIYNSQLFGNSHTILCLFPCESVIDIFNNLKISISLIK